jgi:hypothetical protein
MRRNLAPRGPRSHVGIAEVLDLRGPRSIVARLTETLDSTAKPTETLNSRDLEEVLIKEARTPFRRLSLSFYTLLHYSTTSTIQLLLQQLSSLLVESLTLTYCNPSYYT